MVTRTSDGSTSQAEGLKAEAQVRVAVGQLGAEDALGMEILQHVLAKVIAVDEKLVVKDKGKREKKKSEEEMEKKKKKKKKKKEKTNSSGHLSPRASIR